MLNKIVCLIFCYHVVLSMPLKSCLCNSCDFRITIGRVFENHCYFIYLNDLFYFHGHGNQMKTRHIKDVDVADSLVAEITSELFVRFGVPVINLKLTKSNFFKRLAKNGTGRPCYKLNIQRGEIFDDYENNCPPELSIVRINKFLYYPQNALIKGNNNQMTVPCLHRKESVYIESLDKCYFFVDDTISCTIALLRNSYEYNILSTFLFEMAYKDFLKKTCRNKGVEYDKCVLSSFNNSFQVPLLVIDPKIITNKWPYFIATSNKTGHYLMDIVRRRFLPLETYSLGRQILTDGLYKLQNPKHFCEERISEISPPKEKILPTIHFITTTPSNLTSTTPVKIVTRVDKSTTNIIYISTTVFGVLIAGAVLFYFCRKKYFRDDEYDF